MVAKESEARLPRSVRKHVRKRKAELRRTLSPSEARKAIETMLRRLRHGA